MRVDDRPWRPGRVAALVLRFGWQQVCCCVFAGALFGGLAVTAVLPLPIARYDALLLYVLALTLGFWLAGWETGREVGVIGSFHLIGLALELFKVRVGSWSYPGDAWTKVGGVPLFAGFMYAAVGSYICQAWRRFSLRVTEYPALPLTLLAVAVYVNFFTHHVLPDLRWALAAVLLVTLRRTWVHFTVGGQRLRMPLALSFVLIGLFLWVAENAATLLGAWRYPDQREVWRLVHPAKFGAWSLLVTLSFVLVATVKATEGRLYGSTGATGVPSVLTSGRSRRGGRRGWLRDGGVRDGEVRGGEVRGGEVRDGGVRDGGVRGGERSDGERGDGERGRPRPYMRRAPKT